MGRSVYLFSLTNMENIEKQICQMLLALDYKIIKHDNFGLYLEKLLPYGIIEVNFAYGQHECFMRIAKPNSEETISSMLKDINFIRKQLPQLNIFDVEAKQIVDLNNEQKVKDNFIKERENFLLWYPTAKGAPVRGDEVFIKS